MASTRSSCRRQEGALYSNRGRRSLLQAQGNLEVQGSHMQYPDTPSLVSESYSFPNRDLSLTQETCLVWELSLLRSAASLTLRKYCAWTSVLSALENNQVASLTLTLCFILLNSKAETNISFLKGSILRQFVRALVPPPSVYVPIVLARFTREVKPIKRKDCP